MMMHGTGMLMMFWTGLGILVVIAAVAAIVVWAVRSTSHANPVMPDVAQQILARRYAAGEIDDEEYQRRLRVLRGQPSGLDER
ncbi:SHOCT domain-containing protein [Catelliglobosispora koreensis]|uniref:SHOCT domain-containing protein n=1 Tax=Catelliglobosispora koreensis TaxID=129052 RepID=UPI000368E3E5|nr:SHOCT domain-containing protein [Catelliglobosispora koreensis]